MVPSENHKNTNKNGEALKNFFPVRPHGPWNYVYLAAPTVLSKSPAVLVKVQIPGFLSRPSESGSLEEDPR